MECPYRFSKEDTKCIEEECLSYIIIQKPKIPDPKNPNARLIHVPASYCKILDTDPTQ